MTIESSFVERSAERRPPLSLYALVMKQLMRPRAVWAIALLAFTMSLPAISLGMIGDDFELANRARDAPWAAFEFQSREPSVRGEAVRAARAAGHLPWWVDDGFHQAFLRPLASLSLALDFALWPRAVWWMHVQNSLWFTALVLLVASLYRRLSLSREVALLATLFFALNSSQGMTIAFIAARNTMMATVFGLLSLWCLLAADEQPSQRRHWTLRVTSVCAFGCALSSAEIGVSALAYLLSYAFLLGRGSLRGRCLRCLPYGLVAVAWQALYVLGGYGASTSGFYRTPSADPVGFLLGILSGLPIYITSVLTVPFATLTGMAPAALLAASVLSIVALYFMRGLFLPLLYSDKRARFCALGAALSVLPLGTTVPQDRLVFFIDFGLAALLAQLVVQRLDPSNLTLPRSAARALLQLHTLAAPLLYFPYLLGSYTTNGFAGGAQALERALPRGGERGVVLLNAPMHMPVFLQRHMRTYTKTEQAPFVHLLYEGVAEASVVRTSERTLELEASQGYLASNFERTARDPRVRPFHPGDEVSLPRMRVTVLDVTDEGAPKRVRFEFYEPLEQALLMEWVDHEPRLRAWPPVGERIALPALSVI